MQGQSDYTWIKEERFAPVLAQSLRISKAEAVERFAYYHVDLNAGSGYNADVGVWGSPLNFLSAVTRTDRQNFYAFFVDQDLDCIRELIQRPAIAERPDRVSVFHADNGEVLSVLAEFIAARERKPWYAVGSLLVDPNGYHGGVPWESLQRFCAAHSRIDVFLNLNVRSFKLERACKERGRKGFEHYRIHPVSEFSRWFSRPNWMLTPVLQVAGNSWVQLVGRTMKTQTDGYRSLGFYDIHSDRGRAIVDSIETPRSPTEFPLLSDL